MSRRKRGGKNRPNQNHHNSERHGQNRQEPKHGGGSNASFNSQSGHSNTQRHQQNGASTDRNHSKTSFQSAVQPRRTLNRPIAESSVAPKIPNKRYQVIFFDTLAQAKSDLANLKQLASQCDQLNIIVRAEASMDDQELLSVGKLFCGAAWSLIHERRKSEGWYEKLQE